MFLHIPALVILPLPLCTVDPLFTRQLAHAPQQTAFLELPGHALVHAVLDRVDVLVARDLGLVEFAYAPGTESQRFISQTRTVLVMRRGQSQL